MDNFSSENGLEVTFYTALQNGQPKMPSSVKKVCSFCSCWWVGRLKPVDASKLLFTWKLRSSHNEDSEVTETRGRNHWRINYIIAMADFVAWRTTANGQYLQLLPPPPPLLLLLLLAALVPTSDSQTFGISPKEIAARLVAVTRARPDLLLTALVKSDPRLLL